MDESALDSYQQGGSSEEQKQETKSKSPIMCSEDLSEFSLLLKEIPEIADSVNKVLKSVSDSMENDPYPNEMGLSLLEMKNINLISYMSNMCYLILRKLEGHQIQDDPAVKRLVELRVVMEKMRPIEDKLKYQINKILSADISEDLGLSDPLKFHANPDDLEAQDDDQDNEDTLNEDDQRGSKPYIPPKISTNFYDEENDLDKKKKTLDKAHKRPISIRMLQDLREEHNTGPEEFNEKVACELKSDELLHIEKFENQYMMRIPLSKKQKHDMRQTTTVTNFDAQLEDKSSFDMKPVAMSSKKKFKLKRLTKKGKGKKKGYKKKH